MLRQPLIIGLGEITPQPVSTALQRRRIIISIHPTIGAQSLPIFYLPTGPQFVPGANDIAVVLTDLNNGSIIDDFLSGNKGVPVMINQTSQGNTVQGLIISDEFLTGGIVDINNTANQPLTVHGTNSSDGDFVVNAGVTLNYTGGPFNVTNGFIVIGEGVSDTPQYAVGIGHV